MKLLFNQLIGISLCFLLLSGSLGPLLAQSISSGFEAGLTYQSLDLDGDAQVSNQTPGTQTDVNADFGLGEDSNFQLDLRGRITENFGIRAQYAQFDFDGQNTLSRQITYNDETFSVSDDISTEFEFDLGDLDIFYEFLNFHRGGFLDSFLGFRYFAFKGTVKSSTDRTSDSFKGAIPVIGLEGRKHVAGGLFVGGNVSGLDIEANDAEFQFIDLRGTIGYQFIDSLHGEIGYRDLSMDGKHTGDNADDVLNLNFKGFNVTLTYLFT